MESKLREDLKQAQLMENELVVATLRLLLSEITNAQIAKGEKLSDDEIITVIQKELKKRRESAEAYRNAHREELLEREEAEAAILESYLPEQMSDEELSEVVRETIQNLGASGIKDMGRVIAEVKSKVGKAADGARISSKVREGLS